MIDIIGGSPISVINISVIKGKIIKSEHPKFNRITEVEQLIQIAKHQYQAAFDKHMDLYKRMHNLYMYI